MKARYTKSWEKILTILQMSAKREITTFDIMNELGVNYNQARNWINLLLKKGWIKHTRITSLSKWRGPIGTSNTGYIVFYCITSKGKQFKKRLVKALKLIKQAQDILDGGVIDL